MSRFINAPICDICWMQQNPDRDPVRMCEADPEACYFCGRATRSGIYVRTEKKAATDGN